MKKAIFLIMAILCISLVSAEDYVIVTSEDYLPDLAELIEHRELEYEVHTVFSEGKTNEQIKTEVQDITTSGYVLLVGLDDVVPIFREKIKTRITNSYNPRIQFDYMVNYLGDGGYADVDGDLLPDLKVGRFPSNNPSEIKNMVRKTIAFEKEQMILNKKAAFIGGGEKKPANAWKTYSHYENNIIPSYEGYNLSSIYCYNYRNGENVEGSPDDPDDGFCYYNIDKTVDILNEDNTFVYYKGHGGTSWQMTCGTMPADQQYTNEIYYIISAESCSNLVYDSSSAESYLAYNLMTQKNGAVAYISANQLTGNGVTPDTFPLEVLKQETLGEAFNKAIHDEIPYNQITASHQDLWGDPALSLIPKEFEELEENVEPVSEELVFSDWSVVREGESVVIYLGEFPLITLYAEGVFEFN